MTKFKLIYVYGIFFVFLYFLLALTFAQKIEVFKTSSTQINFGEILNVSIFIKNLERRTLKAEVKEYLPNAEPIQPKNFTYIFHPIVQPPFYSWNITLPPLSTFIINYSIKPLLFGEFYIAPTQVKINEKIFFSNALKVKVKPLLNGICEPEKGENYFNCPEDCPSGSKDGVCDLIKDGRCDPDCKEGDPDCPVCGNKKCEVNLGENYFNCPRDCPSGEKDNYCDRITDGKCDPDCKPEEDPDCTYEKNKLIVLMIIFGVGLIVLIILLKSFKIKREKGIEISY